MTAGPDQQLIFGRAPTGTAILATGLVIAGAAGAIGLFQPNAAPRLFDAPATVPLVILAIALLFTSAAARMVLRIPPTRPRSEWMLAVTFYKVANAVAIAALGIVALAAFVVGLPYWAGLAQGIVIAALLAFAISVASTIAFNVVALAQSRRAA